MMNLGVASAKLSLDINDFVNNAQRAQGAMSDLERSGTGMTGWVQRNEQAINSWGRTLLGFGGIITGALGASQLGVVKDFDEQMSNVNSIAQLTTDQISALGDEVLAISAATGQGPTTLAAGLYDIYSSGFAGAEGLEILDVAARGANAGLTSTDVASRVLTATLNAQQQGADMAGHNMNVLFKIVDQGVITFEQLANNMGRTLPMMNALGVNIEELGAGYALMTKNGVAASETETQLAALMKSAINPTADLSDAISDYGYESAKALIEGEGFAGFLDVLTIASGGSEEKLFDLLGTQEAFNAALILSQGEGQAYIDMLGEMEGAQDGVGATNQALEKQMESTAYKLQKLSAMWDVARIKLGQNFKPAVDAVVESLTDLLTGFIDLPRGLQRFIAFTTAAVGGISLLAGAILLALPRIVAMRTAFAALGGVRGILGGITAGIRAMTLAMLLNPFFLLSAAAIGVGVLGWTKNLFGIRDIVGSASDAFADMWGSLEAGQPVWETVTTQFGTWRRLTGEMTEGVNTVTRVLYSLGAAVRAIGVETGWTWLSDVADGLNEVGDRVETVLGHWQRLRQFGTDPVEASLVALRETFPSLRDGINAVLTVTRSLTDAWAALAAGDFGAMFGALGDAAQGIGTVAVMIGGWAIDTAVDLYEAIKLKVFEWAGGVIGEGAEGVPLGTVAAQVGGWFITQVGDLYGDLKRKIYEWIGGTPAGDGTGGATGPGGANQDIPIGTIGVMIGGWIVDSAVSLYERVKAKIAGWLGLGGGGITDAERASGAPMGGGGIPIGTIAVSIGDWLVKSGADIAARIEEWIGEVTARVPTVIARVMGWDPEFNDSEIGTAIEDAVGEVIVTLSRVAVRVTSFKYDVPDMTRILQIGLGVIVGAAVLTAIPVAVPVLVLLGAVTGGVVLGTALSHWASGWAERNPIEAAEVLMNVVISLGNVENFILGDNESWTEFALALIGLPEDGIVRVSVRAVLDWTFGSEDGGGIPDAPWMGDAVEVGTVEMIIDGDVTIRDPVSGRELSPESVAAMLEAQLNGADTGISVDADGNIVIDPTRWEVEGLEAIAPFLQGLIDAGGPIQAKIPVDFSLKSAFSAGAGVGASIAGAIGGGGGGGLSGIRSEVENLFSGITITPPDFSPLVTAAQTALQTVTVAVTTQTAAWAIIVSAQGAAMAAAASSATAAMLGAMQAGFQSATVAVTTHANAWAVIVAASGGQMSAAAAAAAESVRGSLAAGMQSATVAVTTHANAWPAIIYGVSGAMYTAGLNAGALAGEGVADGIASMEGRVSAAAANLISIVESTMARVGEMRSPSRLTMRLGAYLGDGMALGMLSTLPQLSTAAGRMTAAATPPMPATGAMAAGSAGNTYTHTTTISPTVHVAGSVVGVDDLAAEVAGPILSAVATEHQRQQIAVKGRP